MTSGKIGILSSSTLSHGTGHEGACRADGNRGRRELREVRAVQSPALSAVELPLGSPQGDSDVGRAMLAQPEPIGYTQAARANDDPFSEMVAQGAEAFLVSMEAAAIGDGEEEANAV